MSFFLLELPEVKVALDHLHELENQLKNKDFFCKQNAVEHFKQIADGIKNLENASKIIHEILEVENIEATKLRYTLTFLPEKLRREISVAVAAAKETNAVNLKILQAELQALTEQQQSIERNREQMVNSNAILSPVLKELKAEYDQEVMKMNQKMAQRTSHQITTNETHDKLRDARKNIVDVQNSIRDLKESMVKERKQFEIERDIILEKIAVMQQRIIDQKQRNDEKRSQNEQLNLEWSELNKVVQTQQLVANEKETRVTFLKIKENTFKAFYSHTTTEYDEAMKEKEDLTNTLKAVMDKYDAENNSLNAKLAQLLKDLERSRMTNQDLQNKKALAVSYLAKTLRSETESREILSELTEKLELSEELLVTKVELLSKLRKEIKKIEEVILTLEETLRSRVKKMKIEIEKFVNKLETEEQERLYVQHRLDEILSDLIETKISIEIFLKDMSIYMNAMKRRRNELTERGRLLQIQIIAYTEKNEHLKQQVTLEDTLLKKTEDSLSNEINRLKKEYIQIRTKLQNATEELLIHRPVLEDIERKHDLAEKQCYENRMEATDKETEANSLLSTIKDLKKKIIILEKANPDLKAKLEERRNILILEMNNNSTLMRQVEGELYETGRKLEFFTIENCRLKNCIEIVKTNIQSLKEEGGNQRKEMSNQKEAIHHIYENLINAWADDTRMEQEHSESDNSTLDSIKDLILKIQFRERTVGRINEGLQEHLSRIVAFVETAKSSGKSKQKCLLK